MMKESERVDDSVWRDKEFFIPLNSSHIGRFFLASPIFKKIIKKDLTNC